MSIPKITGREARELLDIWSGDVEGLTFAQLGADRSYGDLFGAAPALAETVAWLYGREPDGPGPHVHRGRTREYDQEAVASHPESGVVEVYAAHDHGQASAFLTPDDAVDLARALLAAAEEARP